MRLARSRARNRMLRTMCMRDLRNRGQPRLACGAHHPAEGRERIRRLKIARDEEQRFAIKPASRLAKLRQSFGDRRKRLRSLLPEGVQCDQILDQVLPLAELRPSRRNGCVLSERRPSSLRQRSSNSLQDRLELQILDRPFIHHVFQRRSFSNSRDARPARRASAGNSHTCRDGSPAFRQAP